MHSIMMHFIKIIHNSNSSFLYNDENKFYIKTVNQRIPWGHVGLTVPEGDYIRYILKMHLFSRFLSIRQAKHEYLQNSDIGKVFFLNKFGKMCVRFK